MKNIKQIASLLLAVICSSASMAQTWNFTSVSSTDQTNLAADTQNWTHDTSSTSSGKTQDRYCSVSIYNAEALTANGIELEFTKGLLFTTTQTDAVRVDISGKRMAMNKANTVITIPNVAAGSTITVNGKSSSSSKARSLTATNITSTSGSWGTTTTEEVTNVGQVVADGDVTITNDGGFYIYSIKITAAGESDPDAVYNSVSKNVSKNQMLVGFSDQTRYYNTSDVKVDIDNAAGSISISPVSGTWKDVFTGTVNEISFAKAQTEGGEIINDDTKVKLTKAAGWNNAAYVEWSLFSGASSYNVYIKGGQYSDFTKIDYQLVRNYGTYGRADALGLKAGTYEIKVVPIIDGAEKELAANTATSITVVDHDRSGFAFTSSHVPGAYNLDGTLKANAVVVYITDATKNTVTQGVVNTKSGETQLTGFNTILDGLKKGLETRPFVFRLIGNISTPSDADKGDILVDLNSETACPGVTIEGVGNDAVANGWGIRLKNATNCEVSNIGFMNCSSSEGDNIGLQQGNKYIWVHNCDMFYGNPGSDADQAKGDGALDCKKSNYITFSYNRFWDNGKCNLLGLSEGSTDYYITYHHNWYDHSDSRHPRCRYYNAHVYNNYFDGNAKYGIGASLKSNIFAENNYFRHTNKPMLTKGQGTDSADNTFEDSSAGMIKAYGNVFAEKSSKFSYVTYQENNTEFDAYEASSRDEQVPSSVTAKVGGTTYRNFDTASDFYAYTPDAANDVPTVVTGQYGAGRVEHGDFQWTFNNATDDEKYDVDTNLKSAVTNYKTTLVGIFDGENSGSSEGGNTGGDEGGNTGGDQGGNEDGNETPSTDTIIVSFNASEKAPSNSIVTVEGTYSDSKGTATYNGVTYTDCVKMESKTKITINAKQAYTMTLVFADSETASCKINDTKISATGSTYTTEISAATTITKDKNVNLFVIVLEPKAGE